MKTLTWLFLFLVPTLAMAIGSNSKARHYMKGAEIYSWREADGEMSCALLEGARLHGVELPGLTLPPKAILDRVAATAKQRNVIFRLD